MISVSCPQAFNMVAVLTDKKQQQQNKKTKTRKNTMISVSNPQAFDMPAVWTVD